MASTWKMEAREQVLYVTASGSHENLQEAMSYLQAIVDAAIAGDCTKVLLDEQEMEYHLTLFDAFRMGSKVARYGGNSVRIALVLQPKYLRDGKFFETVASNRGLDILVTIRHSDALAYLK